MLPPLGTMRPLRRPQTQNKLKHTPPKLKHTFDEALATQTSKKTEEIVAKVVADIDAATEEDTAAMEVANQQSKKR